MGLKFNLVEHSPIRYLQIKEGQILFCIEYISMQNYGYLKKVGTEGKLRERSVLVAASGSCKEKTEITSFVLMFVKINTGLQSLLAR